MTAVKVFFTNCFDDLQGLVFSLRSAPGVLKDYYWFPWCVDKNLGDLFVDMINNYV